jgi:uncharacterized membrane protein
MDIIFPVLGILLMLALPVGVIVLMIGQGRLRRRLGRLEAEVAELREIPMAPARQSGPLLAERVPADVQEMEPAGEIEPPANLEVEPTLPVVAMESATKEEGTSQTFEPAEIAGVSERTATGGADANQNRPIVMNEDTLARLISWFQANWVLVVSAISLALAGVFFVQYGVERGLLPPPVRVLAAIALGIVLVIVGEWVRRRQGDEGAVTAYLPSTFSGAGIVSMFAGVLAARQMYGLIGPETALFGLVLIALIALVLGWFYGPFLAAVGLVGATLAPFLVGGESSEVTWLYAYFALIGCLGLGIDTLRRWAWVSVLALALSVGAGAFLQSTTGSDPAFLAMLMVLVLATFTIPERSLGMSHQGVMISTVILRMFQGDWPSFPVRLAGGMMVVASWFLLVFQSNQPIDDAIVLSFLVALALMVALWAQRGPALADLAAIPAAAFLIRLQQWALNSLLANPDIQSDIIELRGEMVWLPLGPTTIVAFAAVMAAAFALRSLFGRDNHIYWAAMATGIAPATMGVLEWIIEPATMIGAYTWAWHAIVLAAGMVTLAAAFARKDGEQDRRRAAYATLSALVLIPFALFALLEAGALTISLAALVVVAMALDRRFKLPELGWFVQAGIIVLGWRLFLDPGLDFAFGAPLLKVALAFLSAIAATGAGLWLLRGMDRKGPQIFLESGLVSFVAVFADVLLFRWLDSAFPSGPGLHWAATLLALPWLVVALVQLYRAQLGGFMAKVRIGLACIAGVIAALGLGVSVVIFNPLLSYEPVDGPMILNTLFVAYALPGIILVGAALWFRHLPPLVDKAFLWIGAGFVALYVGLEIRHFFQGEILANPGLTQGELYTYTLALMLTGAALLYQAIASRSASMRRIGMAVIGLTIAKVFLIDISGLTGLVRVVAFLGLGLSLAGLAWLNRWAVRQSGNSA